VIDHISQTSEENGAATWQMQSTALEKNPDCVRILSHLVQAMMNSFTKLCQKIH